MKSFKEDLPSYNCEHSEVDSVYDFLDIYIKTLDDGGFHFFKLDLSAKFWTPQGRRILMVCQHPPRLRHFLV